MTPTTPCRTCCYAPGGGCPASPGAAPCAPGCTRSPQRLPGTSSSGGRRRTLLDIGLDRPRHGGDTAPEPRARGGWSPTRTSTAPAGSRRRPYERRESVELAFVAAVQHLPPNQRAVLLMRDVSASPPRRPPPLLDTTVAAVTSALQRARSTVDGRLPGESQQASLRALGDTRVRRSGRRLRRGLGTGDTAAILALLAEDATFSMPPYAAWFRGHAAIAEFLPAGPLREGWRLVPATAGGQLAFGCYRRQRRRAAALGRRTHAARRRHRADHGIPPSGPRRDARPRGRGADRRGDDGG